MRRKDLSFTTPEGKKVYGSSSPPEDIKERMRQQEEREFQLARELSRGLNPEKGGEAKSGKGDKIIEMPSRKKIDAKKEEGEKIAA